LYKIREQEHGTGPGKGVVEWIGTSERGEVVGKGSRRVSEEVAKTVKHVCKCKTDNC
jgi:hypothetical protein